MIVTVKTSIDWDDRLLDENTELYKLKTSEVEDALTSSAALSETSLGFELTARVESFRLIISNSSSKRSIVYDTIADIKYSDEAIIGEVSEFEKSLLTATITAINEDNVLENSDLTVIKENVDVSISAALSASLPVIGTSIITLQSSVLI